MKKVGYVVAFVSVAMVALVVLAATSKCRYCGSTAYGNSCPNGVHVHIDTDANCEYCGYSSYGKSCSFAPRGIHRHGHGNGKCIWCGYNLSGKGCSFAPNGVHEK